MKKILLILIIGVFLINGCEEQEQPSATVMVTSGDYIDCPEDVGEFCIQVYEPVCGDDGETYSNSCVACQTVERYIEGEC